MQMPASTGGRSQGLLYLLFDANASLVTGGEQTRSSWSSQERRLAFSRARRSSDDPRIWIRLPTSNGGMLKSFLSLLFDDSTSIVIG